MKKINFRKPSMKVSLVLLIIINILILGASIALLVIYQLYTFIPLPILLLGLIDYLYYSNQKKIKKQKAILSEKEFVTLFTYFKVYLANGFTVYGAIKEITNFASPSLKNELENFLDKVDQDKSIQPYIDFAHIFKPIIYEQFMISVYQMVEEGTSGLYLQQFDRIFYKLSEVVYREEEVKRERKIVTLGASPLIGAGLIIILITIGVVAIIGEMISGI